MTPEMLELQTWLKAINQWVSPIAGILGFIYPWAILPAFEALRRFWRSFSGLLEAVRIFANRDRRTIDLARRLTFVLSGDQKHPGLLPIVRAELQRQGAPPSTLDRLQQVHAELMEIHRQLDWLRDTAYRSDELEQQREAGLRGEAIFQGELDARRLHVLGPRK